MTELISVRLRISFYVVVISLLLFILRSASQISFPIFLTSGQRCTSDIFCYPSYKSSISVASFADFYTPVWEQRSCVFFFLRYEIDYCSGAQLSHTQTSTYSGGAGIFYC